MRKEVRKEETHAKVGGSSVTEQRCAEDIVLLVDGEPLGVLVDGLLQSVALESIVSGVFERVEQLDLPQKRSARCSDE